MSSLEGILQQLSSLSDDELREYVRRRLRGEPSDPPVIWSHGDEPETFLVHAFHALDDSAFRERLARVVTQLVIGWRPGAETGEYLARLAAVAGDIGASGVVPALRSFIADPAVPDTDSGTAGLRTALLRALLAFPGEERDEAFWNQYFDDPERADLAFLAAYRRDPLGAVRFLGLYFPIALDRLPLGALRLRLANYVLDYLKVDNLHKLAPVVLGLDPKPRERLLDILRSRQVPEKAWGAFESALNAPEQAPPRLRDRIPRDDLAAGSERVLASLVATDGGG